MWEGATRDSPRTLRDIVAATKGTETAVRFNCVVQRQNFDEVLPLVRAVAEWGGTRLYFNTFNLVSTNRPATEYDFYYTPEYHDRLAQAVELGMALGVEVAYFDMREARDFSYCEYPWNNFYISWEGWLVPCCAKPFPALLNFGSVVGGSVLDCVNHPALVDFRRLWRERLSPEFCRNCHLQHPGPVPKTNTG